MNMALRYTLVLVALIGTVTSIHIPKDLPSTALVHRPLLIPRGGDSRRPVVKKPKNANASSVAPVTSDGASIPNMIFNLVKSIVGAGVLGLPAGIAAFSTSPTALIPSLFLIVVIGTLSAYGFSLIGRVCAYTGATSYREAWGKAVSHKTCWIPNAACLFVTTCSVVAYSMILADTIPQLLISLAGKVVSRTQALLSVTAVALLPLCLMKNLKSLGPFSLVGIIGVLYTSCAMALRWLDGTYKIGGQFAETLKPEFLPSFGESPGLLNTILNPNIFLLISMLSTAFMAHYNAPKFYWELENRTIPRYQVVVGVSFLVALLLFASIASLGFATFGESCAGLVLNNYSTEDPLMSLSRVAIATSLLFSYPLAFVGVRDGFLDLVGVKNRGDGMLNSVTVALLAVITGLAFVVKDLTKVLAFAGATWGNALVYLFPTYMFATYAKTQKPDLKKEVPFAITTGIIGLVMGVIGTSRAIQA